MRLNILYTIFTLIILKVNSYEYKYHSYKEINSLFQNYARNFPNKCHLYSIGKSWNNNELLVLAISDKDPSVHITLRPEVKYVANIHGNEVVGKEILLRLIDEMLFNQTNNSEIDYIMKNMRVHFLPLFNPDGLEKSNTTDCDGNQGRYNAKGYDLNRNFPDLFQENLFPIQPETKAYMNWLQNNSFVLSGSFYGGALVVVYPYNNYARPSGDIPKEAQTKDDDVYQYLAKSYSLNNRQIMSEQCSLNEKFSNGIINGAAWYPIKGGSDDISYWKYGCMSLSMEISCCKYPPVSFLKQYWTDNRISLMEFLKQGNTGVKGIVKFKNGIPAVNITISFDSREPYFKTNQNGEYYRILLPGTYNLKARLGCKSIYEAKLRIPTNTKLTIYNITLPDKLFPIYKNTNLSADGIFCGQNNILISFFHKYWTILTEYLNNLFKF